MTGATGFGPPRDRVDVGFGRGLNVIGKICAGRAMRRRAAAHDFPTNVWWTADAFRREQVARRAVPGLGVTAQRADLMGTSWRDRTAGAFRMGLLHGIYCLGCCWLLFVILFPLGMNVGAMAAVTLIILAEKMLPWPRLMPHAAAAALVLYGALVIASSQLHPTFKQNGSAAMPAELQMKMPGSGSAPAMK